MQLKLDNRPLLFIATAVICEGFRGCQRKFEDSGLIIAECTHDFEMYYILG